MRRLILLFFYKLFGWKAEGSLPPGKSCVILAAPHTSNWDLVLALAAKIILGVKGSFIGKKEAFFFPLGSLLKAFGGIPVDRSSKHGVVEQVVDLFKKNKEFVFVLAPEGTRKKVNEMKSGFWHIAKGANVPIVLGYIDYKTKRCGLGPYIMPGNSFEEDLVKIKAFYKGITPKYPELGIS